MISYVKKLALWKTALVLATVVCLVGACATVALTYSPGVSRVIVLDAGHGGADGGVSGVNSGVTESEVNLSITLLLKTELEARGYKVVLTRSGGGSADGAQAGKYNKKADMAARKKTIERAEPMLVVSIHCNKFPTATRRGAQVFFNEFSPEGKELAERLQHALNGLNDEHVGRSFAALKGDYYVLNCSAYPSAIAECGFLSNPEDEALLLSEEYRSKLAEKLADGISEYLISAP